MKLEFDYNGNCFKCGGNVVKTKTNGQADYPCNCPEDVFPATFTSGYCQVVCCEKCGKPLAKNSYVGEFCGCNAYEKLMTALLILVEKEKVSLVQIPNWEVTCMDAKPCDQA